MRLASPLSPLVVCGGGGAWGEAEGAGGEGERERERERERVLEEVVAVPTKEERWGG